MLIILRLVLNYMDLNYYETEWITCQDIHDRIAYFGTRAKEEEPYYTLPVIRTSSRLEIIMGFFDIVEYLLEEYDWIPQVIRKGSRDAQVAYTSAIDRLVTDRMMRMVVPFARRVLPEGQELDELTFSKEKQLGEFRLSTP